MKVTTGIGGLTITFEDGKFAGRTYDMGGDGLTKKDGHGFWVHIDTMRQIEPYEHWLTEEERTEIIEEMKKNSDKFPFELEF